MATDFFNESLPGTMTSNMTPEKKQSAGIYVMAAQVVILFLLLLFSIISNGLLLFLLACFKTLQTTSNMLVVDLAVVDLLHILINVPLFMCYGVLDLNTFRGRVTAWLSSTCHVLFAYLTLTTVFLMMIYRFLAIRFPAHYQIGKSKFVLVAIFVKWLLSFVAVLGVYAPLYRIDLGDASVLQYRMTYNRERSAILPRILSSPPILLVSLSMYLVSWKTLKSRRDEANLGRAQNITSGKREQKASNTILIILIIFCASYLPEICRSAWPVGIVANARQWSLFVLNLVIFLPSTVNPFIYFIRVESFRRAFKELFARAHVDRINVTEVRVRGNHLRRERMLPRDGNIRKIAENLRAMNMSSDQSTEDTSSSGKSCTSSRESETNL